MITPNADIRIYQSYTQGTGTTQVRRMIPYDLENVLFIPSEAENTVRLGNVNTSRLTVCTLPDRTDLTNYVEPSVWGTWGTVEETEGKFTFRKSDVIIELTEDVKNVTTVFRTPAEVLTLFNTGGATKAFTIEAVSTIKRDKDTINHFEIVC